MIDSSLVLFGGFLVVLSLRRKHVRSSKRTRGFLRIFVMLIDGFVLLVGTGALLIGLVKFLR